MYHAPQLWVWLQALARVEEDSEMIDGLAGTANDFEQKLEDTDKVKTHPAFDLSVCVITVASVFALLQHCWFAVDQQLCVSTLFAVDSGNLE